MPIYEYRCEDCGTKFEKLVRRVSEAPELACPACGQHHLKQELSTFAAHASGGSKTSDAPVCPCPSDSVLSEAAKRSGGRLLSAPRRLRLIADSSVTNL
jgi:putative FmdB family regulatory protein